MRWRGPPELDVVQSTLVITIRDITISSLLRFGPMESIMPVPSINLS